MAKRKVLKSSKFIHKIFVHSFSPVHSLHYFFSCLILVFMVQEIYCIFHLVFAIFHGQCGEQCALAKAKLHETMTTTRKKKRKKLNEIGEHANDTAERIPVALLFILCHIWNGNILAFGIKLHKFRIRSKNSRCFMHQRNLKLELNERKKSRKKRSRQKLFAILFHFEGWKENAKVFFVLVWHG